MLTVARFQKVNTILKPGAILCIFLIQTCIEFRVLASRLLLQRTRRSGQSLYALVM